MIRLVAFDIDGTLLNDDHELVASTRMALEMLHEQGVEIVINSGRPYPGVKPIVEKIGVEWVRYVSCFNGGLVMDLKTGDTLYEATFSPEEIATIAQFAIQHQVDVHIYGEENITLLSAPRYPYAKYEADIVHMGVEIADFRAQSPQPRSHKVMITADPDTIATLIEQLPAHFQRDFEVMRSAPYFLEFTPKNVNKGQGLAQLAKQTQVKQTEVLAFGDNENDLSMLTWAGVGVAMGNALPTVKASADTVTLDNNHDGIMETLNHYVFHPQGHV